MPLLLRSDHARVVNVASIAMGRPRLTFNQFDGHDYHPWTIYTTTKLAQAMMVVKLNQLLTEAGQSVTVTGSSPGLGATSLKTISSRKTAWLMRMGALSFRLLPFLRQSPDQAALPALYGGNRPQCARRRDLCTTCMAWFARLPSIMGLESAARITRSEVA